MANNRMTIEGLDEFTQLPRHLRELSDPIVRSHAERAYTDVRSAYKVITGTLRDGVVMNALATGDPYTSAYVVASTAEYAPAYEFGRQTDKARRGRPTFIPITQREQSAKSRAVAAMLREQGFVVTGEDA
jgi:hypothetical protein